MTHLLTKFLSAGVSVLLLAVACLSARADVSVSVPDSAYCSDKVAGEIGVAFTPAYVMPTNRFLRGDNPAGSRIDASMSARAQYVMRFTPSSHYGRWYPYAYQGLGVGVTSFFKSGIFGSPLEIYATQGSRIASLSTRLSVDYEWNFGASFGWKRSEWTNTDRSLDGVGSSVNAYISLAFMLSYQASPRLTFRLGPEITHYSNGNTSLPNPGINRVGLRLAASYRLHGVSVRSVAADWSDFKPGVIYDLTMWGAWRKWGYYPSVNSSGGGPGMIEVPGSFGVCGINFNPLYRFNPVVAAGVSLDFMYDDGANLSPHYEAASDADDPKFYRQSFKERVMGGLSFRVEISMPVFSINIGLGHSVYAPGPATFTSEYGEIVDDPVPMHAFSRSGSDDTSLVKVKHRSDLSGLYQTFTLKTHIWRGLYLNTGYRLVKFSKPGNLMLGLGYRFQ